MNGRSLITPHGATITDADGCVLCADAETKGPQEIPARADARTAFSLQSRLRRMRQNPISRPYFEPPPHSGTMLGGGGGMRHPNGCNPGWRAPDPPGDQHHCLRLCRAEEIRLPVHERAAVEAKTGSFQTVQVPELFRSFGWTSRASRRGGLP